VKEVPPSRSEPAHISFDGVDILLSPSWVGIVEAQMAAAAESCATPKLRQIAWHGDME